MCVQSDEPTSRHPRFRPVTLLWWATSVQSAPCCCCKPGAASDRRSTPTSRTSRPPRSTAALQKRTRSPSCSTARMRQAGGRSCPHQRASYGCASRGCPERGLKRRRSASVSWSRRRARLFEPLQRMNRFSTTAMAMAGWWGCLGRSWELEGLVRMGDHFWWRTMLRSDTTEVMVCGSCCAATGAAGRRKDLLTTQRCCIWSSGPAESLGCGVVHRSWYTTAIQCMVDAGMLSTAWRCLSTHLSISCPSRTWMRLLAGQVTTVCGDGTGGACPGMRSPG